MKNFKKNDILLFYDSKCSICKNYKSFVSKINKKNNIIYINMRKKNRETKYLKSKGYNFNEGLILMVNKKIYQGKEAIQVIHQFLDKKSFLEFILNKLIQLPGIYSFIKFLRKILLILKGIKPIK